MYNPTVYQQQVDGVGRRGLSRVRAQYASAGVGAMQPPTGELAYRNAVESSAYAGRIALALLPLPDVPDWVEHKLSVARTHLGDVKHYLDFYLPTTEGVGRALPRSFRGMGKWYTDASRATVRGGRIHIPLRGVPQVPEQADPRAALRRRGMGAAVSPRTPQTCIQACNAAYKAGSPDHARCVRNCTTSRLRSRPGYGNLPVPRRRRRR